MKGIFKDGKIKKGEDPFNPEFLQAAGTAYISGKTHFSVAWESYARSEDYRRSITLLEKKGIYAPYSENILKLSFSAGYNSK